MVHAKQSYVLKSTWNHIFCDQQLDVNDGVKLWSFRICHNNNEINGRLVMTMVRFTFGQEMQLLLKRKVVKRVLLVMLIDEVCWMKFGRANYA